MGFPGAPDTYFICILFPPIREGEYTAIHLKILPLPGSAKVVFVSKYTKPPKLAGYLKHMFKEESGTKVAKVIASSMSLNFHAPPFFFKPVIVPRYTVTRGLCISTPLFFEGCLISCVKYTQQAFTLILYMRFLFSLACLRTPECGLIVRSYFLRRFF